MTDLAAELVCSDVLPSIPEIRVGWLGHKSQTIGDGLRTYSREVTAGLADRAEIVFIHHEKSLDDGRSSHALHGHPAFQRRFTIAGTGDRSRLEGLLREHAVDVVHLSAPFSTLDFRMPGICHRLGIPIVATFHVPFARELSTWGALSAGVYHLYARALAACDRVIVLGEAQRLLLIALGVPEHLIVVLPNGVDTDKFTPGPSPALESLQAERIFSFCGRVDPEKRVETLLQAFLQTSPPRTVRMVIVGEGVDLARLRRGYQDERIVFLGPVLNERTRIEILRASDAFFLPSRVEALSLALLEAMACGVAVAATGVGNHAEVLEGAGVLLRNAHLFDDLRSTIGSFIETPALCRSLGARARARVVANFSLAAHLDGVVALYRELLLGSPALAVQRAL
ncbi:MAG: glycosyltransferase family 4 protein [Candidatus Dormibacteraeota bacterium]|nr:glycosyltransferase family 4 protein [Candidatus Dormibacteraeota bacterium]